MQNRVQSHEIEAENAAVHLGRDTDEFLLADDADLQADDIENEILTDPSYGTLVPYGWDYA